MGVCISFGCRSVFENREIIMKTIDTGQYHRLVKAVMDSGEAATTDDALAIFGKYRLRLHLGGDWNGTRSNQAAVAIILNTATRAFLGGVYLSGDIDGLFTLPILFHQSPRSIAERYGAFLYDERLGIMPTLNVGESNEIDSPGFSLRVVSSGWVGGVLPISSKKVLEVTHDFPLAGIAAASIAVSEAFTYVRNEHPAAGFRAVGISLWNLNHEDWLCSSSQGPEVKALPNSLWLVGLGHLGQAYAWSLAMLPYEAFDKVKLFLQDDDFVEPSNLSTCMLVEAHHIGKRKTRIVAEQLEELGFNTSIVERLIEPGHLVQSGEPRVALIGVDNVSSRRHSEQYGFDMVVEAGLGGGYSDFRKMRLHTFPGPTAAVDIWRQRQNTGTTKVDLTPAYKNLLDTTKDECGVVMLASRSVGTPFVGSFAACLALSEIIRLLHGGRQFSVLDFCLSDIGSCMAIEKPSLLDINPGYESAA